MQELAPLQVNLIFGVPSLYTLAEQLSQPSPEYSIFIGDFQ